MACNVSLAARSSLALLTALCSTSFFPQQLAAQSTFRVNAANHDTLIVGLTVEGGGTLGSYEAGLTWALVEIFRQRRDDALRQTLNPAARALLESLPTIDLRAAAGASAGSINAYIAANEWCSRGAPEVVDSSSFWKIWIPTGIRQLLPDKGEIGDRNEKAILSRVAFTDLFGVLDRKWSRAQYDSACTVLFGATVTRIQNDSVPISDEIFARNQRFAAAFSIKPVDPKFGFPPSHIPAPRLQNSQFSLGALVELPVLANNAIDRDAARNLIRASSGYPLAFEPQQLTYCADPSQSPNPPRCDTARATKSYFVDGGVFDNGPLTLAYGLALAHPKHVNLGRLTMLFVTPSQIRGAQGRVGSANDSSDTDDPPPEAKSGGLDALTKLFAAFVPSARQYELQIAHRLLPTIQESDSQQSQLKYQRDSARDAARDHAANVVLVEVAREKEWDQMGALRDSIRYRTDSLRYLLMACVVNHACATALHDDTIFASGLAPVFRASAQTKPEDATSYPAPRGRPKSAGQSFEKGLYATRRWHQLAGDWLLGFGGLLGRPLREYDFYVGVYDGMALLADRMLCTTNPDPDCLKNTLRFLIEHPLLPLSATDSTILAALHDEEFGIRNVRRNFDSLPRRQGMVVPVIWAMADWKRNRDAAIRKCSGGPIESFECTEGIEFVFRKLRHNRGYVDRLKSAPDRCRNTRAEISECITDEKFAEIVDNPYAGLNRLAAKMLMRVAETTPRSSGTMMPLSLGMALYFATNERARLGRDMGSTSLPIGRPFLSRVFFAAMPSSVGGFAGVEGWYFEWAARWHFGRAIALGATTRAILTSGFTRPGGANENHAVPGLRLEWKFAGPIAPWISTAGLDATTWTDGVTWPTHINRTTASWGGTALFLAQRIRVSVQSLPAKYRIRGQQRPWGFVSIGFGDTNGFVYWLSRRLFSFVR